MIWVLLVVYQIKHFVADYPLQGPYMLRKFLPTPHWIVPLMAHAGVHGLMTYFIALPLKPGIAHWLALFDFAAHLSIDRVKASPNMAGRFKALTKRDFEEHATDVQDMKNLIQSFSYRQEDLAHAAELQSQLNDKLFDWDQRLKSNTYFWWALGADQGLHHLTHYFIIYLLLN